MSYLYPYGDTQQLNLSWFLAKFKELYEYISNLDPNDIALATVLSRFTNEYNSSTNYIPGDYVIHEGFIYKANQSTTGNFNPQAWDAALPVNDIQGLRILLGGLSTDLANLEQNAVTNLQYTPGAATADGLLRQTKNGAAETVMHVDKEPTANSQNPVKSGAVRAELNAISDAVTDEQNQIDDLNDITGDGSLSGFTATDLTGAANELKGSLNSVEDSIAFIINGKRLQGSTAVSTGQYVLLMNSTISGKTDGLYKASQTIPINTDIDGTYLTAVSGGAINNALTWESGTVNLTTGGGTLIAASTRLLYCRAMHIALFEFQVNGSDGNTELTLSIPSTSSVKPIYAYNQLTNTAIKCTLENAIFRIWDASTLTRASLFYYIP